MPTFEICETKKLVKTGVVEAANDAEALRLLNEGKVKLKMDLAEPELQITQLDGLDEEISEKMVLSPCA